MEGNFQGDLADVVRASGSGSGAVVGDVGRVDDFPVDQLPLTPPLNACEGFGDPFSSMRDPLVVELEGIGHGFHGDHFSIGDERSPAASAFRVSCSSDSKSIDCDLRGGFTACGVMNPSSPKGLSSLVDTTRAQISSPRNPILKRRKSQAKKVVCIPAPTAVNSRQGGGEVVPSDLWAWRKYGQKPIKGSPYPRGYYRCSSSKGCSARKQVERSRTDPNMLVITYTSEHNHPWPTQRNSLAGSSRIPAATSPSPTVEAAHPPSKPPPLLEPDKRGVALPSQPMMSQLVFDYDNDNNNENENEKSYRPVLQEEGSEHDFFADLRELEEAEALSLLGGNKSLLDDVDDPFGSLFDWSTSNSSTTANSDPRQNSH